MKNQGIDGLKNWTIKNWNAELPVEVFHGLETSELGTKMQSVAIYQIWLTTDGL